MITRKRAVENSKNPLGSTIADWHVGHVVRSNGEVRYSIADPLQHLVVVNGPMDAETFQGHTVDSIVRDEVDTNWQMQFGLDPYRRINRKPADLLTLEPTQ